MSRSESDAVLKRLLAYLQGNRKIRLGIGFLLVGALLVYAGRSAYNLIRGRTR